jgi:hypothetical protein
VSLWQFIEDQYVGVFAEEPPEEIVEALNGFALVNRGSTSFIRDLQTRLQQIF